MAISDYLAFYKFDDDGNDQTGNYNTTFTAGGSFTGRDVRLDGNDDFFRSDFARSFYGITGAFTFAIWIRVEVPTEDSVIYTNGEPHGTATDPDNGSFTALVKSNAVRFRILKNSTDQIADISTTALINDQSWHHVVFTWDGTTNANNLKTYVNKVLDNTATQSVISILDVPDEITTFSDGSTGIPFNGNMSNARIYGRALPLSDIEEIYDDEAFEHSITYPFEVQPFNDASCVLFYEFNGSFAGRIGTNFITGTQSASFDLSPTYFKSMKLTNDGTSPFFTNAGNTLAGGGQDISIILDIDTSNSLGVADHGWGVICIGEYGQRYNLEIPYKCIQEFVGGQYVTTVYVALMAHKRADGWMGTTGKAVTSTTVLSSPILTTKVTIGVSHNSATSEYRITVDGVHRNTYWNDFTQSWLSGKNVEIYHIDIVDSGATGLPSVGWNDPIDNFRMFNRQLTDAEMLLMTTSHIEPIDPNVIISPFPLSITPIINEPTVTAEVFEQNVLVTPSPIDILIEISDPLVVLGSVVDTMFMGIYMNDVTIDAQINVLEFFSFNILHEVQQANIVKKFNIIQQLDLLPTQNVGQIIKRTRT